MIVALQPDTITYKDEIMTDKVTVFDTTLRDGEQAAGTRLGSRDKLTIARQLARLNVDVIEAGYPASSPEDFEAVELIAREIQGPAICALSRAVASDIEACGKALAKAKRPRIHTGIGVSDIHVMGKFRDDKYGVTLAQKKAKLVKMATAAVKLARSFADAGATWIHVVDLDAARSGSPVNRPMVAAIAAALNGRAQVQTGGGVRSVADVEELADAGVARVVMGSAAVRDPQLVVEAAKVVSVAVVGCQAT